MKIRKYSIAWFCTRKPVQVLGITALTTAILLNTAMADTKAEMKPVEQPTMTIEESVEQMNYKAYIEELNPCKTYDVPLDEELKCYIETMCRCYEIRPEIVYGIMAVESNFNAKAVGDNGNSLGLMQIQPRWNKQRMEDLNVTDLLDAKQNAHTGIDILAELLEKYSETEALVVYNMGESGANKYVFSKGKTATEYSESVLAYANNL